MAVRLKNNDDERLLFSGFSVSADIAFLKRSDTRAKRVAHDRRFIIETPARWELFARPTTTVRRFPRLIVVSAYYRFQRPEPFYRPLLLFRTNIYYISCILSTYFVKNHASEDVNAIFVRTNWKTYGRNSGGVPSVNETGDSPETRAPYGITLSEKRGNSRIANVIIVII